MSIHSDLSQASTILNNNESPVPSPTKEISTRKKIKHAIAKTNAQDVLLFLLAFRILNALCVDTFFQPDEFFQSLEPAWRIAFGSGGGKASGAWLTWEWRNHLRSAIHPSIFATAYWLADRLARLVQLTPTSHADLLMAAPKTVQAVLAALQDFYTWELARSVFGHGSNEPWVALALTVFSPWQWFCSTRTFSNGLETTLTIMALYFWPWHWLVDTDKEAGRDTNGLEKSGDAQDNRLDELPKLRSCLLLAGLACVLRPTNILIWIPLSFSLMFVKKEASWLLPLPRLKQTLLVNFSHPSMRRDTQNESIALIRETAICGIFVLTVSILVDRVFYQAWAFPPLKFLLFNVVQSLAVFYGRNRWDYYLTEGLPLLLTTALPFALVGLAKGVFEAPPRARSSNLETSTFKHLTIICLILPLILSLIGHKEVRFIYPLLPALHIIASPIITSFFRPAVIDRPPPSPGPTPPNIARPILLKRLLLASLILVNLIIAIYTTRIHAPGPLNVLSYLRNQYLTHHTPRPTPSTPYLLDPANNLTLPIMTVGFLMPCHSTPWRSHLIFPSIHAWSLTCDPPLTVPSHLRPTYLDEADQFYANPSLFIKTHMSRHPPRPKGLFAARHQSHLISAKDSRKEWPEYLVFFAQLEPTLDVLLRGSGYAECWRGWNTHWHDDWRRQGDIVAWCLYPERRVVEKPPNETFHQGLSVMSNGLSGIGNATAGVGRDTRALVKTWRDAVTLAISSAGKKRGSKINGNTAKPKITTKKVATQKRKVSVKRDLWS